MLQLDDEATAGWRQALFAVLSLAVLVGLIYSDSLHVPFLFDDMCNIKENANLFLSDLSWNSLRKTFYGMNAPRTTLVRPFASLSFGLNYYFGGFDTIGYHAVNISVHFLAALFLYLFIRETLRLPALRSRYGSSAHSTALLAAVLWASHPIQTQAVTYIVQRMASMAALFYVASIFFFARGRLPITRA